MMFKIRTPKIPGLDYQLPVHTTDEGRWYQTPEGNRYPSASTVAGILNRDTIAKWRKRVGSEEADKKTKMGANRGTYVHHLCEKYLLNSLTSEEQIGMMPSMKDLFLQLKKKFDKHIDEVLCVEQALYCHRLKIAGRCDAVVIWDGVMAILDIKTAGYVKPDEWILNYYVQTTSYAEMFEERTGIAIEHVVLATAVEKEVQPTITMKKKTEYLPVLDQCIATYYMEQGGVK